MDTERVGRARQFIRESVKELVGHENKAILESSLGFRDDGGLDSGFDEGGEQVEDAGSNVTSDTDVNVTSVDHHIVSSHSQSVIGIHSVSEVSFKLDILYFDTEHSIGRDEKGCDMSITHHFHFHSCHLHLNLIVLECHCDSS